MNETPVQTTFFPSSPAAADAGPSCAVDPERGLRLRRADRAQLSWGGIDLEAALPEGHPARAIHAVIAKLDLGGLYGPLQARGETAGAPAIDPQILLALWFYATSEGVGSGRLERLSRPAGRGLRSTRDPGACALGARPHRPPPRGAGRHARARQCRSGLVPTG
jgi:hypothetical protein